MASPGSPEPLPARLPGVWRGSESRAWQRTLPTGLPALDAILPGGGWPVGALTEILTDQQGIGELRLLLPALVRLSREGRWLAWVAPPHLPYAPALAAHGMAIDKVMLLRPRAEKDRFWALEQALRSASCGAVLAWPGTADNRQLRRLQLAAERGSCWGILFRPADSARQASPAALRLQLQVQPDRLELTLLKCRGGLARRRVELELPPTPPLP